METVTFPGILQHEPGNEDDRHLVILAEPLVIMASQDASGSTMLAWGIAGFGLVMERPGLACVRRVLAILWRDLTGQTGTKPGQASQGQRVNPGSFCNLPSVLHILGLSSWQVFYVHAQPVSAHTRSL